MKFMHLGDLHLGKRIHEVSLIEDQIYILDQIIEIIKQEQVKCVLIAGDIYDKSVPIEKGVNLFDDFLTKLNELKVKVIAISGNHDSGDRVEFGSRIFAKKDVYLAGVYKGKMNMVKVGDEYGDINVYMLPFIKPYSVRPYFKDVETYEDAVKKIIEAENIDYSKRNILIAHQFITNSGVYPETCDSETISVGGIDNIDCRVFKDFDYVALGHIHGPQKIGAEYIRYSGSPLKYSFSEAKHNKSVTIIELNSKEDFSFKLIPLVPMKDLRVIKGPINELLSSKNYSLGNTNDYMRVILTDEEELVHPLDDIKKVYPNTLRLDFENSRTRVNQNNDLKANDVESKSTMELFMEFYFKQNNTEMNQEQIDLIQSIINKNNLK